MRIEQRASKAIVQIEDSGAGIPKEYRERVFDRFYRLDGDRHASGVSGSGLGLAIVKHIVLMHGGTISLGDSEDLGGLCVTIIFDALESKNAEKVERDNAKNKQ